MLGVSDRYMVITSGPIGIAPNFVGSLQTLTRRGIIPPRDHSIWPVPEFLAEHRKRWRL